MLDHYAILVFNRISMGVQDFNKAVQKAVNREQDEEFVNALLVRARELGFQSTNLDLNLWIATSKCGKLYVYIT